MRLLAMVMILSGCGDTLKDTIDLELETSCTECTANTSHTLDVLLRKTGRADGADYPADCTIAGDANIQVAREGSGFMQEVFESARITGLDVTMLDYEFRCTGDGVITVDCNDGAGATAVRTEDITCIGAPPAGPPAATFHLQGTTSAFASWMYSSSPAFSDKIAADFAKLDTLAVGACTITTLAPANATLESAGTVEIKDGNTTIATLDKSPSSERREKGPINVTSGQVLDIVVGGAGGVGPSTGNDVLRPAPTAQFTNLTFVDDILEDRTFIYNPVSGDRLYLTFSYLTASNPETLVCRLDPAGTSYTMQQTDFDRLGISGTVRAETHNIGTFALAGVNGSVLVTAQSNTPTGQYTKQ